MPLKPERVAMEEVRRRLVQYSVPDLAAGRACRDRRSLSRSLREARWARELRMRVWTRVGPVMRGAD